MPFPTIDALTVNINQNVTIAYCMFGAQPMQKM